MSDRQTPRGPDEGRPKIHVRDRRQEPRPPASERPAEHPQEPSADLEKLAQDRLDQLLRLKADFENFRRRELKEKTEIVERASLRIVERLLPVLDDLERALGAARAHEGADGIVRGIELVHKHLHDVLVEEGLEKVEAEGRFDPEHHEAVSSVPGDVHEPTVLEVVRPGYRLKGKTIRPALVHVSIPQPDAEDGA